LIQVGDIADRNADVFECVQELLKIKHMIVVRGSMSSSVNYITFSKFRITLFPPEC
jgi:hypothetical protein